MGCLETALVAEAQNVLQESSSPFANSGTTNSRRYRPGGW